VIQTPLQQVLKNNLFRYFITALPELLLGYQINNISGIQNKALLPEGVVS